MNQSACSFWDYSNSVYRKPGVEAALLGLQQRLGLDINLVLFCFWLAQSRDVQLSTAGCVAIIARTTEWQNETIRPLRLLRQRLKANSNTMPQDDVEQLRRQVQALELQAEHIEQNYLEAEASRCGTPVTCGVTQQTVIHNLAIYMQCVAAELDSATQATLLDVVSTLLDLPADNVASLWRVAITSTP